MKEKHQLIYQKNLITYYVIYKNQKNIILKLIDNQIVVSAPINTPIYLIEPFVYKHISKLLRVQNSYEFLKAYDFYSSKPWVKVFENPFEIQLVDDNIHSKIIDNKIVMKNYFNNQIQLEKIYNLLAKSYKNWFVSRTNFWAEKMQIEFNGVSVKVLKSKWGYCNTKQKNIVYNTKLIHFEPKVIDYVIVHELSHIIYPNHSKDFWRYLSTFLPDYQKLQEKLNSKGI
ncbi:SprT family zinc-dependent metalloprotease [Mycoplasma putrefaciens]|uniref:Metal-dependent hydrolase n=1 Tax=Mycoplasma putrefaciens (strain ATCC 15718 / NCTC 10155 / C30 KS-1 / KS-1) TaxID=743965 RepID=A0A7U4E9M9_MYCPK|nr:SprT family zinc-dependent metalloprotease [Mycoplasma putrefaciens]AEM69027.1 putative metal-dependent hydrolase [Mycoplasma putrefaciens KS1]